MRVFIDTEFTDFRDPLMLSFGAVSDDGRELYLELDLSTPDGEVAKRSMSSFVQDIVVPQFGLHHPQSMPSRKSMGEGIAAWLLALGTKLELVYDYKKDLELLVHALKVACRWEEVGPHITHAVLYRDMSDLAEQVMETSFRKSEEQGLFRHHALADARALRAAYAKDRLTRL